MDSGDQWPRSLFWNHPLLRIKDASAFCGGNRPKVFCKQCWAKAISDQQQNDGNDVQQGRRQAPRSDQELHNYLWNHDPTLWVQGRRETVIRHLKSCSLQPTEVRDKALREAESKSYIGGGASPQPIRTLSSSQPITPILGFPLLNYNMPPPMPGPSFSPAFSAGSSLTIHPGGPSHIIGSHSGPYYQYGVTNPSPLSSSAQASPLVQLSPLDLNSPQMSPMITPASQNNSLLQFPNTTGSISRSGTPQIQGTRSSKRARLSSRSTPATPSNNLPIWTDELQTRWARSVARLTASCGFPYSWVENPQWIEFCSEWIPGAIPIFRKALANRWIPEEVERYRDITKKEASGSMATIQCDGWSGINFHHFVAFMITTELRKVYTVRVYDTSTERKTAENLLTQIKEVCVLLREQWGVVVVAVTSDASGESRKARKLLIKEFPELLGPDCYAHQVALVVADYFRAAKNTGIMVWAEMASDLITWLRSKTQVLGLIRAIQETLRSRNPHARILTVIRAVITRWTAHFAAYARILDIRWVLEQLVHEDEALPRNNSRLMTGDKASQQKAEKMIAIIKNSAFWHNLARMKKHLEPLARASCIMQAAHARLDDVPLIFGTLTKEYRDLQVTDGDDEKVIDAMLKSIEKRWKSTTDQEIFILTIILHPALKLAPFSAAASLSRASIWGMVSRTWMRFFNVPAPVVTGDQSLFHELREYLDGTGKYSALGAWVEGIVAEAEGKGENPDPQLMWAGVITSEPTPLQKLAKRLFAICANSASCERLFSLFGIILTRRRSRLRSKAMTGLAELRMHLRDENRKQGSTKERLKRKLTSHGSGGVATVRASGVTEPLASCDASAPGPMVTDEVEGGASGTSESDSLAAQGPSRSSFTSITNRLISTHLSPEDLNETDEMEPPGTAFQVTISDMFDFQNGYWIRAFKGSSMRGLMEEMELHELLDMDAEGEIDSDYADNEADLSQPTVDIESTS